jgi:transcription antitermination factor NusG
MADVTSSDPAKVLASRLNAEEVPCWFAAYTAPNHEKRVAEHLDRRSIEQFLPVYESVRRWKDRQARLQVPLFSNYVFVRIALRNRVRVLEVPRIIRLVGFGGRPAALPEEEIEALRRGLSRECRVEPHPFLNAGRRVRVRRGPFEGAEGILLRARNSLRVVLSLEVIQRSVAVEIDAADIEPLV